MNNEKAKAEQTAVEQAADEQTHISSSNQLGYSLYHPRTGEMLFDGGSGPEVDANRAEFERRWQDLGFPGSPKQQQPPQPYETS